MPLHYVATSLACCNMNPARGTSLVQWSTTGEPYTHVETKVTSKYQFAYCAAAIGAPSGKLSPYVRSFPTTTKELVFSVLLGPQLLPLALTQTTTVYYYRL